MAAIAEARRLISPTITALVRRRLASLAGLLLGLAGIGLGVALASYHPSDASFDTAGTVVRNLAGPTGAIIADLSWQGFGVVGLLPVGVMLLWGWRIAEHRRLTHVPLRLLALAVAMPLLAGGLANLPVPLSGHSAWLAAGWGGAVGFGMGNLIVGNAHAAFGPLGTALAWVVEVLIGIGLAAFGFGLTALEWRTAGSRARTGAMGAALLSGQAGRRLAFGMDGVSRGLAGLFTRLPDWGRSSHPPEPTPHPIFDLPPMDPEAPTAAFSNTARREPVVPMPAGGPAGAVKPVAAAAAGADSRIRTQKGPRPATRNDAPAAEPHRLAPAAHLPPQGGAGAARGRHERRGDAGQCPPAGDGTFGLRRAGQHRGDPSWSRCHALRAGAGSGHSLGPRHWPGRRRGAQPLRHRRSHRDRPRPQRHRH